MFSKPAIHPIIAVWCTGVMGVTCELAPVSLQILKMADKHHPILRKYVESVLDIGCKIPFGIYSYLDGVQEHKHKLLWLFYLIHRFLLFTKSNQTNHGVEIV